ncbi:MAG TPA: hypothetical protein QGF05_10810 [Dehalococcoidia bacterium]|nr:hypothetical protein [Dehalococcoidia bacterium]
MFEILSAYVTDLYFNQVYGTSQAKAGESLGAKEAYQQCIQDFVSAVNTQRDSFQQIMQRCYVYAREVIGSEKTSLNSVKGITETLAQEMVPTEFFREMNEKRRGEIVELALVELIKDLCSYCLEPDALSKIVDQHDAAARETIRMMQMHGVRILARYRDTVHNRFFGRKTGATPMVEAKEVDHVYARLDKLRERYDRVKEERDEFGEQLDDAEEELATERETIQRLYRLVQLMKNKLDTAVATAAPQTAAAALAIRPRVAKERRAAARRRRPARPVRPATDETDESETESESETGSETESEGESGGSETTEASARPRRRPQRRKPTPRTTQAAVRKSVRPAPQAKATSDKDAPVEADADESYNIADLVTGP